ncbi:MAG: MoaD/ThiS family protein [Bacteroidetes bacterium]|nr:MoaD/ThiS family protein [Bacteroidota bacterium]
MKIFFFGVLADVCGVNEISVEHLTDIDALKIDLKNKYPLLDNYNFQVVVNSERVSTNVSLNSNDEVAFLPPFAGG